MRQIIPALVLAKVELGNGQPDFQPVVAALAVVPGHGVPEGQEYNAFVLAFTLDDDERAKLVAGADLYLTQITFNKPIQAVTLAIGKEAMAEYLKVEVGTPAVLASRVHEARQTVRRQLRKLNTAMDTLSHAKGAGIAGDDLAKAVAGEHEALVELDGAMAKLARARVENGEGIKQ